jgi:hypothetical protein
MYRGNIKKIYNLPLTKYTYLKAKHGSIFLLNCYNENEYNTLLLSSFIVYVTVFFQTSVKLV